MAGVKWLLWCLVIGVSCTLAAAHERTLFVSPDDNQRVHDTVTFRGEGGQQAVNEWIHRQRMRRDEGAAARATTYSTTTKIPPLDDEKDQKKIIPKIYELKDSHAQLMVHWLGGNTKVLICLARETPSGYEDKQQSASPSVVFISFDYGDTFENKTDLFRMERNGTVLNTTLDGFSTHPKFNTIVFTDQRNKAVFTSSDHGRTVQSHEVDFTPSEVSFYEADPYTFLILDKDDPDRKLYFTTDFGKSFTLLQSFVKSYTWSPAPEDGAPIHLYVERRSAMMNTSAVIFINGASLVDENQKKKFNPLIESVHDFSVKGHFMFATRKMLHGVQLLVSYKRNRFLKAEFQTELELRAIHVADVEGLRIFVSAVHSETLAHLYVSEIDLNVTTIRFTPSLENVFTYIPELTWRNSWLVTLAEDPFTELYKVEGLRGIYIASYVSRQPVSLSKSLGMSIIGLEHLSTVITFDHGSSWRPITAPTVDDDGVPINCTKDCSLHLAQKFSLLYPMTRSPPIASSKSAPGVIMASGVIGRHMKGHYGVFISRDAGLTWKQILKGYHFFNLGDHGGILVAIKYFKTKGETRELLYSTDEGEKWHRLDIHSKDLKVYGLMTEPNTNSTSFTVFGSEVEHHQWQLIKVDLKSAFSHNCTELDYKFWAPGSQTGDSLMRCLMGEQVTYQRRIPHSNCYNGQDYVRPMKAEKCLCNMWDFECDYGFSRLNENSPCIRNKTMDAYDPFKIPSSCVPGGFYQRTKGYRKIDGNVCFGGYSSQYLSQTIACPVERTNNFLIVAQRDKISKVDLTTNERTILPVEGLKNVIAIEFDMQSNCVFYADIQSDTIGRQCLNGNQEREILAETELASVEGMSYDWVTETLFFVDGFRFRIEAMKTSRDSLAKMRRTIIDTKELHKPRGIVVHPIQGYLFWTDWSTEYPSLSRANMDGSDIRALFSSPRVVWPNGVSIDFIAERVYWVDASQDYIGSCDLHGRAFKKVLQSDKRVEHPFAVAIFKDTMYWDDWKMNAIFAADKSSGMQIQTVIGDLSNLMDLKLYGHSLQEGQNACSKKMCSHFCVGAPNANFSCLCPDGMTTGSTGECLCPGGTKQHANRTCPQLSSTCGEGYFTCANNLCIPNVYRCDGENDCGDKSDEQDCGSSASHKCSPHMFQCKSNNMCIPNYFACDHEKDCEDGSDEFNCNFEKCKDGEFQCKNGKCILGTWVCDGEDDCRDRSDEQSCNSTGVVPKVPKECAPDQFRCHSSNTCMPNAWRCDRDTDCADGTDEKNCTGCDNDKFSCGNGQCIFPTWVCDGEKDCANGEDEANCKPMEEKTKPTASAAQCHDWMFKCSNGECVPSWWKCDGVKDCSDNSDELGCGGNLTTTEIPIKPTTPTASTREKCKSTHFHCDSGECITKRFLCDGTPDCPNGEDERGCPSESRKRCAPGKFRCISDGACLPIEKFCDGVAHCADQSDERHCEYHTEITNRPDKAPNCKAGMFMCDNTCKPMSVLCNNKMDCLDGTDERQCTGNSQRVYQVVYIGIDERALNATNFLMYWWISVPQNVIFEYLPSVALMATDEWRNHTEWITGTEHRFMGLRPYTTYNVTVFVRVRGTEKVYPPYLYSNVTTAEGIPSSPLSVNVTQLNGSKVQVSWLPPKNASGVLTAYTVYYSPVATNAAPPQPQAVRRGPDDTSAVISSVFHGNTSYQFWVRARNTKYESSNSQLVKLLFDDASNIDDLKNLHVVSASANNITIAWEPIKVADGYVVYHVLPQWYPKIPPLKQNGTTVTLTMVPGVRNDIKVAAYVKSIFGKPDTIAATGQGSALPEVPDVIMDKESETDRVQLHWSRPKLAQNEISYGVYYGTSLEDLMQEPRIVTKNTSAQILDLMQCESYYVSVGIVGPIGPGPLLRSPKRLETHYNNKKPPRNLRAFINDRHELNITWENSCPFVQEETGYMISVTERTLNKTSIVERMASFNRTLSHIFHGIPDGASYDIKVSTSVSDAQPAQMLVFAPPLPMPTQLKVFPEKNGSYVVAWRENLEFKQEPFFYQLFIYPGLEINETSVPINTLEAAAPPIVVNPLDFGKDGGGKVYTMAIRLRTKRGFLSSIAEIEHVQPDSSAALSTMLKKGTSPWLIIVPILFVIVLASVALICVQRHRRLHTSFSRFANSHYDTKTGATRIGSDALEEVDDHHEVTPRFTDDEPLVVA